MSETNNCEGCVHVDGHNSNYMGDCETCTRNPDYEDWYWKEE